MTDRRAAFAAWLVLAFACVAACAPRVTPPDPYKGTGRATPGATVAVVATPYVAPTPVAIPTATSTTASNGGSDNPCGPVQEPPAPKGPVHTIRFLDVGQGDSALIKTANGKTVLIDAGDREAAPAVLRELKAAGITKLDLLVASHPHLDHIGGMIAVIDAMPVRLYVDPGTEHSTDAYRDLMAKIAEKKIPHQVLRAGKTLKLGDEGTLAVLSPGVNLIQSQRSFENANSLVIKATFGTVDVLFTGDAEPETLDPVADAAGGSIEVLKVAHHGSHYGTDAHFLDALDAKAAVISVAARNDYKHPHKETLALLLADCVPTFRTDRDGTVTLLTDGLGWRITGAKGQMLGQALAVPEPDEGGPGTGLSLGTADPAATPRGPPAGPSGTVFASKNGKVYHPAGCPHIQRIKEENRVEYSSAEEAEGAGLRAGTGCRGDAGGGDPAPKATAAATAVGPGPTPAATPATALVKAPAGAVFASKNSKVYHPAGCPHILRIKEENRVEYPNAAEAEAAGLRAGQGCRGQ